MTIYTKISGSLQARRSPSSPVTGDWRQDLVWTSAAWQGGSNPYPGDARYGRFVSVPNLPDPSTLPDNSQGNSDNGQLVVAKNYPDAVSAGGTWLKRDFSCPYGYRILFSDMSTGACVDEVTAKTATIVNSLTEAQTVSAQNAAQTAAQQAAQQEAAKAAMLASPTAQYAPGTAPAPAPIIYQGYTIAQNAQNFFMVTSSTGASLGGYDTLDQAKARVDQAVGNTLSLTAPAAPPGSQTYRNYTITLETNRYIVTSPTGRELGIYTSLTDSQKAIDADIAAGNISAPIPPTQNGGQVVTQADITKVAVLSPGTGGIINPGAAPTITKVPTAAPGSCAPFDIICIAKNVLGLPKEGDKRTVQCPQDPSKNVNQIYQNGSWVTMSTDINVCAPPTLEGSSRTIKCPNDNTITITQKYTNGEWVTIEADKDKCKDNTMVYAAVIILVVLIVMLAILKGRK